MADDYSVLKEKNLRQMVAEYESERQKKQEQRREYVEDMAALENARVNAFYRPSITSHYNPKGFMRLYAMHFYENARANTVRNYAIIYDSNNLDQYPVATPLPRMEDVWNPYFPFNYSKLKEFAAHCSCWRQK